MSKLPCPDCGHPIDGHTVRVGENLRICYRCDCYRYTGEGGYTKRQKEAAR